MLKNLNAIKERLRMHQGSERVYHGWNKQSQYTEGVRDLLIQAEAYWLYDIIQTEVVGMLIVGQTVDTFNLKIDSHNNHSMDITMLDYKGKFLWSRFVHVTTFPEGSIELVVGWDGIKATTCLINEN